VALLYLGGATMLCCLLSLNEVIATLVVLRISVQFLLQHAGLMLLRRREPERPRPFRVWLYPLPPILAMLGFIYILVGRVNSGFQLLLALGVVLIGAAVYGARKRLT
jgi:amino acid transporter